MSSYIGRFAPSPSGPLHFGSLTTALFSYLHAKQHQGKWLVRIEDIDTPRSVEGADQRILESLLCHGLVWDGEVYYQSRRTERYHQAISLLSAQCFFCTCTRAQIKSMGGSYNGKCRSRNRSSDKAAIRFMHLHPQTEFTDLLLGKVHINNTHATEDFIIKRKDGLFAYHLAVVCDDIDQGVTHIVRGSDLLETTTSHLALYRAFAVKPPHYMHLPVICNHSGKKLSKQNHAPALNNEYPAGNLIKALSVMKFTVPSGLHNLSPKQIIEWAIEHAPTSQLPEKREMIVPIA